MLEQNKVFAEGFLGINETSILTAENETVVRFFRITNKGGTFIRFGFNHVSKTGQRVPLTNTISMTPGWALDILDEGQEISLQPGESITGWADLPDVISYVVSGKQILKDILGR